MRIINVIGYEGLYAITDDGRIFSLKKGIELKPQTNVHGYLFVNLSKDNKKEVVYIHKAVFYSFNAYRKLKRDDDLVIDHIDGDKTNNRLENLRKITTRLNTSRAKTNKYGKGVHYFPHINKYGGEITIENTKYYLGTYTTPEEAAESYRIALRNYETDGTLPFKKDRSVKYCKVCGQTKPITDFYYVRGHGYQTYCKECQRAYGRERRKKLRLPADS